MRCYADMPADMAEARAAKAATLAAETATVAADAAARSAARADARVARAKWLKAKREALLGRTQEPAEVGPDGERTYRRKVWQMLQQCVCVVIMRVCVWQACVEVTPAGNVDAMSSWA